MPFWSTLPFTVITMGPARAFVDDELAAGNDVLLDIDVQGALQVKEKISDALLIFVLPPSLQALRTRLKARGLDKENVIETRLQIAKNEINHYENYEYVIINEDIEESSAALKSVILAARCRLTKQKRRTEEIFKTFKPDKEKLDDYQDSERD